MKTDSLAKKEERRVKRRIARKNLNIYLFLIPGILFIFLFRYMPMYGIVTGFQDYNIFSGILHSPWVGFKHFNNLFSSPDFYKVLRNTLIISFGKILFTFPMSILIAILLNEIGKQIFKKVFQTVLYLPHFLSWVIVTGLVAAACSPSTGAAITGINPELYEAAKVDGAGKIKQIIHITLPGMLSIILLMFILKLGGVLNANTEQILLMYNPTVYNTGDVLGTYIYRTGVSQMNYSYATAIGLFESLVGLFLVLVGNYTSKKATGRSIW